MVDGMLGFLEEDEVFRGEFGEKGGRCEEGFAYESEIPEVVDEIVVVGGVNDAETGGGSVLFGGEALSIEGLKGEGKSVLALLLLDGGGDGGEIEGREAFDRVEGVQMEVAV